MIMNFAKLIFCLFFVLLEIYHLNAKNVIGPQVCNLDTVERYESNEPQKLKQQYISENGNEVMDIFKFGSTVISSLKEDDAELMCRCFAEVYYSRENLTAEKGRESSNIDTTPESSSVVKTSAMKNEPVSTIDDNTSVTVNTHHAYCRERFDRTGFNFNCMGLPVVKCSIGNDKVFYLAESAKVLFGGRLRNIYLFELNQKEAQNLRNSRRNYAIYYPAGDFKLLAKAVNLKRFQWRVRN